ncbi:caveolin-1-like [Mytilus edulis]|uniref:Caveolin n=1 Tax=Mytilus galloprovincialis TaxID=29158 RepID=A0A8B6FKK1_MYTGA|nr:caveolin 3 [Mytilus galloprovincialis]
MDGIAAMRDPNSLNDHVMIQFDGVIGEPPTAESMYCVWKASDKVFTGSMDCCYKGLTAVCGVPCALMWGLNFACLSFKSVWCVTPCVRMMKTCVNSWSGIYNTCVKCVCQPCYESVGAMFSNIKVTQE